MDSRINLLSIRLRSILESGNAPRTQADLAAACGVDQPLISRILRLEVRQWRGRILKVAEYVENLHTERSTSVSRRPLPPEVVEMVGSYLDAGCDIDLLRRQLDLLQAARLDR